MRRFVAILLMLAFGSFLGAPLLAASNTTNNLPACCRRGGAHHCMEGMTMADDGAGRRVSAPFEKCPFFPRAVVPVRTQVQPASSSHTIFFAGLQSHPACVAQTQARARVSFDRSRQKRGPPSLSLRPI